MPKHTAKKAFTLVETMISFTIIGILTALVVPGIVSSYQDRATVAKVHKFYKTFNDAYQMARVEKGAITRWVSGSGGERNENGMQYVDNALIMEPILKHIKVAKNCGDKLGQKCVPSMTYLLNGDEWRNYDTHPKPYYKVILEDGSTIWMRHNSTNTASGLCQSPDQGVDNVCAIIWYDTNGPKGPNTVGKDTFLLHVLSNRIIPNSADDCYLDNAGWGCAAHVIKEGNLKYPKKKPKK